MTQKAAATMVGNGNYILIDDGTTIGTVGDRFIVGESIEATVVCGISEGGRLYSFGDRFLLYSRPFPNGVPRHGNGGSIDQSLVAEEIRFRRAMAEMCEVEMVMSRACGGDRKTLARYAAAVEGWRDSAAALSRLLHKRAKRPASGDADTMKRNHGMSIREMRRNSMRVRK